MKSTMTLSFLLLAVFLLAQSPMSIEYLPDLTFARQAEIQICTAPNHYTVIGGHVNNFLLTKNAEIYNPTTKVWEIIESMDNRDMGFVAKLSNGNYLIGGGYSSSLGVGQLHTSEIYDPVQQTFTVAANMKVNRASANAATLTDGRVLVIGNWYNNADYAEVYDPATNTYTSTGNCQPKAYPVIIPTDDGGAIVFGTTGIYGGKTNVFKIEKYDPISNSFSDITADLFNGEQTFNINVYQPTLTSQFLLPNGNYAVLVNKSDNSQLNLISVNPTSEEIEAIITERAIPIFEEGETSGYKYGTSSSFAIDKNKNLIHLVQQASIDGKNTLRIVTINLTTSSVNSSKMDGFDFAIASSNITMLDDGRILFTGGNKPDNFTLSAKAFIITPANYEAASFSSPTMPDLKVYWNEQNQSFVLNQQVKSANLFSVTGQLITTINNGNCIPVSDVVNGTYILKAKCFDTETTANVKLIKP